MNAITILRADHQQFLELFEQLDQTTDNDKNREILFQRFEFIFTTHTLNEEKIFYPAVQALAEFKALIDKSYQSHHIVDVGLKELHTIKFNNPDWLPTFRAIRDSILTHMQEEEEVLFPQLEGVMKAAQLAALGQEIAALRRQVMR